MTDVRDPGSDVDVDHALARDRRRQRPRRQAGRPAMPPPAAGFGRGRLQWRCRLGTAGGGCARRPGPRSGAIGHGRITLPRRRGARRLRSARRRVGSRLDRRGHPRDGARRIPDQRCRSLLPLQVRADGRVDPIAAEADGATMVLGSTSTISATTVRDNARQPPGEWCSRSSKPASPSTTCARCRGGSACAPGTSRPRPASPAASRTAPTCRSGSCSRVDRRRGRPRPARAAAVPVRHYDDTARIEVDLDRVADVLVVPAGKLSWPPSRSKLHRYVTLDPRRGLPVRQPRRRHRTPLTRPTRHGCRGVVPHPRCRSTSPTNRRHRLLQRCARHGRVASPPTLLVSAAPGRCRRPADRYSADPGGGAPQSRRADVAFRVDDVGDHCGPAADGRDPGQRRQPVGDTKIDQAFAQDPDGNLLVQPAQLTARKESAGRRPSIFLADVHGRARLAARPLTSHT